MICLDCGNTKEFHQEHYFQIQSSETAFIDGESEDITEWDNYEENDRETSQMDPIQCSSCDSENIESELTEQDIAEIKWEHTKKDGTWSEEELPEDERDERILEEHAIKQL